MKCYVCPAEDFDILYGVIVHSRINAMYPSTVLYDVILKLGEGIVKKLPATIIAKSIGTA